MKVIYPGPAVPMHMADGGYYVARGVALHRGVNELGDKDAADLLLAGHVLPAPDEDRPEAAATPKPKGKGKEKD